MSVATQVIVQGTVGRITERKGLAKESGNPYRIVEAFIVGPICVANVTLADGIELRQGENVSLHCEIDIYRNDDQVRAVSRLDVPVKA